MPWPTTRQPQCAQVGASAWIAHSKESDTRCAPPAMLTAIIVSYSLPQTSQVAIGPPLVFLGGTRRAQGDTVPSAQCPGLSAQVPRLSPEHRAPPIRAFRAPPTRAPVAETRRRGR